MGISDINFTLPPSHAGAENANKVYLITPNNRFDEAWDNCNPDQANPEGWKPLIIESNKTAIASTLGLILPVPHIRFGIIDGEPQVEFVDGRHRFLALKELGMNEIPCLIEGNTRILPPFIRPASRALREKLKQGQDDGQGEGLMLPSHNPDDLKKWAQDPAVAAQFLEIFKRLHGDAIAQECLEYYQEHGKYPPQYELDQMHREAERKAVLANKPLRTVAERLLRRGKHESELGG